jgi:hypothetical protein
MEKDKKECNECGNEKSIDEFAIRDINKGTYHNRCKVCTNLYAEKWRNKNKESIQIKQKEWYETKGKEWKKEYEEQNRDHINKTSRNRYKSDKQYRMKKILRSRFKKVMLGKKKYNSILSYINLPLIEFNKWIEYQFDENMNWDNQGIYWDIDHVMPCSSFDLTKKEEIAKCFNWKNMRPLKKEDNNKKSNKIDQKIIRKHKIMTSEYILSNLSTLINCGTKD